MLQHGRAVAMSGRSLGIWQAFLAYLAQTHRDRGNKLGLNHMLKSWLFHPPTLKRLFEVQENRRDLCWNRSHLLL
ncbi:hypothetical protein BDA96_07G174700 [Sorghum bicolor]|uniref:Uncharacterized protein n=1 Tax=Sorghum bicolor TaxID=4558 RepID=A0A921QNE1_SORBI|nr:hypothetical protein BDA96_07G174700 [Sorghum bicolor]